MAKRRIGLTEKKIEQMEKEGRGQGTGEDYKPWINIQDFPSNGLSTRGKGWKTNRIHQFYPSWNVIISMCWNGTTLL